MRKPPIVCGISIWRIQRFTVETNRTTSSSSVSSDTYESSAEKKDFKCYNCGGLHYSDDSLALCGHCKQPMTCRMTYVAPPADAEKETSEGGGFVKGVVTYMVMDDLVVQPMSTISSFSPLTKFYVKDISALKEKEVRFGLEEAEQVLTAVFLKNN